MKKITMILLVFGAMMLTSLKSEAIVTTQTDCIHDIGFVYIPGGNSIPAQRVKFATIPWYMSCQAVHTQVEDFDRMYCDANGNLVPNAVGLSIPNVILYGIYGNISLDGCNILKSDPGSHPATCEVSEGGGGEPLL